MTAGHADDYARDQQLVRYPASPSLAPQRWDLLPCQIKINPYAGNHGRGRNVIACEAIGAMNLSLLGKVL